ncbi:hypothetical protein ABC766_00265 [Methylobacterium fujisawaense]|uniref:hypothetical protein n=1 Tax=Methylobacterium fujisawaense TaxID=107400 RepID=UPI0031F5ADD1
MNDRVIESFMVSLGFKADTAALDATIAKLRELSALVDRLRAQGVDVEALLAEKSGQPVERIRFAHEAASA